MKEKRKVNPVFWDTDCHNLCETLYYSKDLASSDTFLLWSYVLILIGGSVTPVLHLMTDEAVSSLGLGILRKKNCLKKIRWLKNTGTSDDPGHTNGNYNDEALWNILYLNK